MWNSFKVRMKRFFLKVVIIIGIIGLLFVAKVIYENCVTHPVYDRATGKDKADYEDFPQNGFYFYDTEEDEKELERQQSTPSDLEGISVYEKGQMGLNMWDNSDTDGDGLTDKEEIEEYNTDPLKCSTSGDFYPDGYKIKNGMKVKKKYDYDGDLEASSDDGVVTIYAKTPYDLGLNERSPKDKGFYIVETDRKMYVSDYTENAKRESKDDVYLVHNCSSLSFYKAYQIGYYDGDKFTVDLDLLAEEIGVDAEELDAEAYSSYHDEMHKKRKKNIITFTTKHENGHTDGQGFLLYEIYITKKEKDNSLFGSFFNSNRILPVKSAIITELTKEEFTEESAYSGLIVAFPVLTWRYGLDLVVYCSTTATPSEKQALLNYATKMRQSVFFAPPAVEKPVVTEEQLRYVDYKEIEQKYILLRHIFGTFHLCKDGNMDPVGVIHHIMYASALDYQREISSVIEENRKKELEALKFGLDDEFYFGNFKTPYLDTDNQGVCAGLSLMAAEVYNNGSLKNPEGSYTADMVINGNSVMNTVDYNINGIEECETFFDRYIRDYDKNFDEFDKNTSSEDEKEFVKLTSCYWRRANDIINEKYGKKDFYLTKTDDKARMVDWDSIEEAVSYLDRGKVLLWLFNVNNEDGAGHCVNIVDYARTTGEVGDEVRDAIAFTVYDTNYPQELKTLFCYKMEASKNKSVTFFEYRPSVGRYETSVMFDDSKDIINGNNTPLFAILNEDLEMISDLITVNLK